MKKLAIVIPLYKINYFEETLESICCQTDKRFNLYIGNDKSPANFDYLIEKYKNKFDFTYHCFENNLGGKGMLVEQWNRCIDLTNDEEYIQILGDDDFLSPNFVETFYQLLDEKKSFDLLRFKMIKVSDTSEFLKEFHQIDNLNSTEHLLNDLNQIFWISISENIFSRKIYTLKRIKNYPLAWRSDVMLVFEFGMNNIEITNDAFVAIRRSALQLTMSNDAKNNSYKKKAMQLFYMNLLENYEYRFNKKDKSNFTKKLGYYTEKIDKKIACLIIKNDGILSFLKIWKNKNFSKTK